MSLDVSLVMPGAEASSPRERIFVRINGRTREVTHSEWAERYPGREPVTVTLPESEGCVYDRNITHNLGKMAAEAGLYEAMWRPDEQGWTHAHDLIRPLRDGLAALQASPDHYKAFNPENGWGDYEGLLDFAASYLAACMKWPSADVEVSR